MADIAPLTPLCYDLGRLPLGLNAVVAPPYDVISPQERATLAARDPHNIVRLILPEVEGDANGDKYAEAARLLSAWREEGALMRDPQPAFYRHDQTFVPPGSPPGTPSIRRRGFLALVRLVPFSDRVVLPHERTLSGPKEDRLRLFRATRTNLSPGFMLYRDPQGALGAALETAEPLAQFNTDDGVQHALAKVSRREAIATIVTGIARSNLLIADGHHRYETALRYAEEAAAQPGALPNGEHRYFMTFLVNGDDPDLVVFPTHRHVHSLPSFSFDDMATKLGGAAGLFQVETLPTGADATVLSAALARAGKTAPSLVAAAPDGRAILLTLGATADLAAHPILGARPQVLRRTDVTLLHAGILEPLLGITPEAQAAKTNIWYPQDARAALAELRAGKGNVLFLMNATPVADVRQWPRPARSCPRRAPSSTRRSPPASPSTPSSPTRARAPPSHASRARNAWKRLRLVLCLGQVWHTEKACLQRFWKCTRRVDSPIARGHSPHVRKEADPRASRGRAGSLRRRAARPAHPQRRALPGRRGAVRRGPREVASRSSRTSTTFPRPSSPSSRSAIRRPTIRARTTCTRSAAPRACSRRSSISSGNYSLILQGLTRIRSTTSRRAAPYLKAKIKRLEEAGARGRRGRGARR